MAAARPAIRTRAWIAIGRVDVGASIGLDGNDLPNFSFSHACKVEINNNYNNNLFLCAGIGESGYFI